MIKVLAYHKINNIENFEKQIIYLKAKYNILTLDDFKKGILNSCNSKNSILLTFDDGDVSLYKNAFPVLKKYNVPAVIFVITNLIGTSKPFWWDAVHYYLDFDGGDELVLNMKGIPNKKRLTKIQQIKCKSKKREFEYSQLTDSQLEEMNNTGISIANHSHTHPIFDQCSNQELILEMNSSTNELKERNYHYDVFAYPNGNYSVESEKILEVSGIQFAFLFDHKLNEKSINPLRISRLIVDDFTSIWKLIFILSGYHSKILPLRKKIAKWI